jgi:hypothetical protein
MTRGSKQTGCKCGRGKATTGSGLNRALESEQRDRRGLGGRGRGGIKGEGVEGGSEREGRYLAVTIGLLLPCNCASGPVGDPGLGDASADKARRLHTAA